MEKQCLVIHPLFHRRRHLRKAVAKNNKSSTEADCGEMALRTLLSCPAGYSLALIDLNTPGINGPELLKIIKQDARLRHLKVIIVAEDLSPAVINDLLGIGADDCLNPDLSQSQLEHALAKACRS